MEESEGPRARRPERGPGRAPEAPVGDAVSQRPWARPSPGTAGAGGAGEVAAGRSVGHGGASAGRPLRVPVPTAPQLPPGVESGERGAHRFRPLTAEGHPWGRVCGRRARRGRLCSSPGTHGRRGTPGTRPLSPRSRQRGAQPGHLPARPHVPVSPPWHPRACATSCGGLSPGRRLLCPAPAPSTPDPGALPPNQREHLKPASR